VKSSKISLAFFPFFTRYLITARYSVLRTVLDCLILLTSHHLVISFFENYCHNFDATTRLLLENNCLCVAMKINFVTRSGSVIIKKPCDSDEDSSNSTIRSNNEPYYSPFFYYSPMSLVRIKKST
jgi:hypothetical protein